MSPMGQRTTTGGNGHLKMGLIRHFALQLRERSGAATVRALANEVGIPDPLQEESDFPVTPIQEAAFLQGAADAAGDIDFGFVAGAALSVSPALPSYIAEHSKTLGDGIVDAIRFMPLLRPGMKIVLETPGNVAAVRLTLSDPALLAFPRQQEAFYAGMIGQIRSFTARPFNPEALSFRHDRVPLGQAARKALGCAVEFGAEQNEMLIGLPVLDRPIRGRDDGLRALLVAHGELLESSAEDLGLGFAERVELFVQRSLPADIMPDAEAAARELGVSRRTLSRKLAVSGTSFADILSKVRLKVAARELLETDRQVGEIAWRLGYNNQANFSTAFRRLTGLTPSEFRSEKPRDVL